jgi:site-specific recombinase XerD
MSTPRANTVAEHYDRTLRYARHKRLPPGYPTPRPTAQWPAECRAENIALLEHYREWLLSGGHAPDVVDHIYLQMAGHVLGLSLKSYRELDLGADLERALDYIKAKQLSAEWTDINRVSLEKFRRFLRQLRGEWNVRLKPLSFARYTDALPEWLLDPLTRYFHLQRGHWRTARLDSASQRFWLGHTRVWRWVLAQHPLAGLHEMKRQYLLDYAGHALAEGYAASTVNTDLRTCHAFLLFLQDQEYRVPQSLLRPVTVKEPERLPRFLTDEQVRALRDEFERRVADADTWVTRRDALLDRATFCLLWQCGLRIGELEELLLEDLDLSGKKLIIRQGKGQKDRAAYLTETVITALNAYLSARGLGPTEHVFLYRNQPLCKDLVRERIKAAGRRVGVKVTPHQLRHTCATQLLNAGCRVTSIQKLLGHRKLDSTLIYARVHDHMLAADFYAAMARIEQSLKLKDEPPATSERESLLALAEQLAAPQLGDEQRLELAAQLRGALCWKGAESVAVER